MVKILRYCSDPVCELKWGRGEHAVRKHAHSLWSFSIVLSGRTQIELGRDQATLSAGSSVAIPSGVAHLCTPEKEPPFAFAVLYCDEKWLKACGVDSDRVLWGRIGAQEFQEMLHTSKGTEAGRMLGALLQRFERILPDVDRLTFPKNADSEFASVAIKSTSENRFKAYRQYAQRYSLGPHAVRQNRRIELAKAALRTGLSVAETAAACEFYDQSHFVKTFRLYTGTTPSLYQKGI